MLIINSIIASYYCTVINLYIYYSVNQSDIIQIRFHFKSLTRCFTYFANSVHSCANLDFWFRCVASLVRCRCRQCVVISFD